jgi:hypothetical protein
MPLLTNSLRKVTVFRKRLTGANTNVEEERRRRRRRRFVSKIISLS